MAIWDLCRLAKQYSFSASHFLPKVVDGHPCKRLHGHNYIVEIEYRGEIGPSGFAGDIDFAIMDDGMRELISILDHHHLNDIEGLENPTAENIAVWILKRFTPHFLYSVKVWETPKCWAQVINKGGLFHKEHKE